MQNSELIIEGLSKLEMLSLKRELDNNNVVNSIPSDAQAIKKELGKHYEFVSTAIIVIGITNVALKVIKIWLDNRKDKIAPTASVKLPDDQIIKLEGGGVKPEDKKSKNIEEFVGVLESVEDVFKEL